MKGENSIVIPFKNIKQLRELHCGENSRIFRDAADQTLPVTEDSEIGN